MNTKSRIESVLKTTSIDASVTGMTSFHLSKLKIDKELDFQLPTNVRLGHLAEKVVSGAIKASSNYTVLHENVQIKEEGKTIGEIDYILENKISKEVIHMELAYKFYLYDPNISTESINNWIGPNRNDSLSEKLLKLKGKQFPLLHQNSAKLSFPKLETSSVSQHLCLLASLFVPFDFNGSLPSEYEKAIVGYYIDLNTFIEHNESGKNYYLPSKKEWGMDPSENECWSSITEIEIPIQRCMEEKQAPLVWEKQGKSYTVYFIVWW